MFVASHVNPFDVGRPPTDVYSAKHFEEEVPVSPYIQTRKWLGNIEQKVKDRLCNNNLSLSFSFVLWFTVASDGKVQRFSPTHIRRPVPGKI